RCWRRDLCSADLLSSSSAIWVAINSPLARSAGSSCSESQSAYAAWWAGSSGSATQASSNRSRRALGRFFRAMRDHLGGHAQEPADGSLLPLDAVEQVAHLLLLRLQVTSVALGGGDLDGHPLDDPQPVAVQADHLPRIVRQQADVAHAQVEQD